MAKKKKSSGEQTPLRRSARIIHLNSVKLQKSNTSRIQVCISPISSYSQQLNSPIRAIKIQSCSKYSTKSVRNGVEIEKSNLGCRRSPRFLQNTPEISEKKTSLRSDGVNGVEGCRGSNIVVVGLRAIVGSKMSARKIDGVGEFRDCRRSPRFAIARNTPRVLDKKESAKFRSGFKEFSGGLVITPETFESKKCGKLRKGAKESTRKINVVEREACVVNRVCGDSAQCLEKDGPLQVLRKRKSVNRGKSSVEVLGDTEIQTPKNGKEKKKKIVNHGSKENLGNNVNQQREECGSLQEVQGGTLSPLRTPFGSAENICPENAKLVCHRNSSKEIENICPENAKLVCHRNTSKEIVESKGVLKKDVKPTAGSRKNSVKALSNQCGAQGWNEEQELALQRAYLTAKPSPHFWKKISKLVPGKTAQDCFDKIQSDSISTPQPQTRYHSRANKTNPSPLSHFSLSGSKLLESAKPTVKKSRGNKRTKCQAHKTARHLLQKQNLTTQGFQRDLFSILEPSVTTQIAPEVKSVVTPISKVQNILQRSSSSNKKKSFSRFRDSSLTPLVSPPVLKRVKNMAIHEKYIDQLHNREAKRMAGGRKCVGVEDDRKGKVQKVDVIKAAKNALVCDARDMIKTFQHMQANAMNVSEEDFDDEMSEGEDAEC
ncbi:hypothetical protein ACHQM5_016498 [Ranunculus cassubicifolius]